MTATAVPKSDIFAAWSMDTITGGEADLTGNGRDLSVNTPASVARIAGIVGGALRNTSADLTGRLELSGLGLVLGAGEVLSFAQLLRIDDAVGAGQELSTFSLHAASTPGSYRLTNRFLNTTVRVHGVGGTHRADLATGALPLGWEGVVFGELHTNSVTDAVVHGEVWARDATSALASADSAAIDATGLLDIDELWIGGGLSVLPMNNTNAEAVSDQSLILRRAWTDGEREWFASAVDLVEYLGGRRSVGAVTAAGAASAAGARWWWRG